MTSEGKAKDQIVGAHDQLVNPRALRAAAQSPSGMPSPMPMPTATNATAIEVRAPTMIMLRMSRPKWSVPNQFAIGGLQLVGNVHGGVIERRPDKGHQRRHHSDQRQDAADDQIAIHVRALKRGSTAA